MRTRKAAVVLVSLLLLSLTACGGGDDDSAEGDEPLTIGMTVERTGALDIFAPLVDGAEAAVDYLNAHGGADGREVELIVRDNASDPTRAVQTLRELAAAGASIVVGGAYIQNCAAIRPIAARVEVPHVCLSPNELEQKAPPYQYGVGIAQSEHDASIYEYLAQEVDTVGTLAGTDFPGDQAVQWAQDAEQANDISVLVERTDTAATTARPQLQKMIANGVEALYMASCAPISITAASEAVQLRFDGKIFLAGCFASQAVARSIRDFVNGKIMTPAPEFMLSPPYTKAREAAVELYNKEVGTKDTLVADGWDAVFLAAAAAEKAGSVDPQAINEALEGDFEFFGTWAGGTFTEEDHRGQVGIGVNIPAVFTPQGDLKRAEN